MGADVGEKSDGVNTINITPLVDVCLVLVLIFMITMPLSVVRGIDVRRQMLKKYGLSTPQKTVTVHLTMEGLRVMKGEGEKETPIAEGDVAAVLRGLLETAETRQFFLQVDLDVSHGKTVWAMDMAKSGGAESISLVEK